MTNRGENLRIILSGGGTGGSITPLLAIAEEIMKDVETEHAPSQVVDFLWLGTKKGIEKEMVDNFNNRQDTSLVPPKSPESLPPASAGRAQAGDCGEKISFKAIHSGKLRRYFDFRNFIDPFFIILGFFESLWIIMKFKPDIIITAGGFVAVPVVWAGWILRVPILVHQQDVEVGLANKLMATFASIVTCSLKESCHCRDAINRVSTTGQIYFTGNAVRRKILEVKKPHPTPHYKGGEQGVSTIAKLGQSVVFKIDKDIPTLLVIGGGTGALAVNTIIAQSLPELTKICNIIHLTGDKKIPVSKDVAPQCLWDKNHYHPYQFLNNIEEALSSADIIISRCGMCVLTELAILGKPAILIPIPDSHQETNAKYFSDRNAAIVLNQKELTSEILISTVRGLLKDKNKTLELSENISTIMPFDGASRIAKIVMKYILK